MHLQSVEISDYKNLKDFTLAFDTSCFIDVFVGKNGTGKSNLFEAMIEIFRHLYEFNDKRTHEINFDYTIKYEINGVETEIVWKNKKLSINGKEQKRLGKTPLPDNVLIYYSGHNTKVTDLVTSYENSFKKRIKKADVQETRKFIGIGKEYKQLLLAVLLLQKEDNKARQFICSKLGIKTVAPEVKLVLKRPYYAKTKSFDIKNNDVSDRYWKAEGITKTFLEKLTSCKADDSQGPVRTEGYISKDDEYTLYFDISKIQKEFSDYSSQELFRQFDNLKTIDMLQEISIAITLKNGIEATINHFSDGQFQSVYIYSIIELFKDRNCITLLDEPDCFLHPEWQFDFLKQVVEITDTAAKNNHVLMSSHSATTITSSKESLLSLFEIDENGVIVRKISKREVIKSLSKGFIKLSEDETIMNINTFLRNTTQPTLFTEGISDEYILETVWGKLYPDNRREFCIHNAFDRAFLRNMCKRDDLRINHPNRLFFALFDFDDAYDDWKQIEGADIITDPYKGLIKKSSSFELYACLLPVSNNEAIKKQVFKPGTDIPWDSGKDCHLTIELLFYGIGGLNEHFTTVEQSCGGKKVEFIGDKVSFAEKVIPNIAQEHFEIFRPMFEFIRSECKTRRG